MVKKLWGKCHRANVRVASPRLSATSSLPPSTADGEGGLAVSTRMPWAGARLAARRRKKRQMRLYGEEVGFDFWLMRKRTPIVAGRTQLVSRLSSRDLAPVGGPPATSSGAHAAGEAEEGAIDV